MHLWGHLLFGDLRVQRKLLDLVMGDDGRAILDGFEAWAPELGTAELVGLHATRHAIMREWSAFFAEHAVLLSPTWALRAFEHDADIEGAATGAMLETFRPVLHANFLGLPAVVVPGGVSDGLPVGVQLIGDRFTDLRCLAFAAAIEERLGTLCPIDPVTTAT
jgi:amidase